MKQSVAVLDFGTSKITVLVGCRGLNNSISLDGVGIFDYPGFIGGEWLAPDSLGVAIGRAISGAESSSRQKIDKLYVGVPGDFLCCETNEIFMSLGKKRKVTELDIDDLHARGNVYGNIQGYTVINIQPIYYTLDDDRKLIAPVGMTSTRIGGNISYILARNDFIKTVDEAAHAAGVAETEYVASPLAEELFLFDDYKRDNCVMLADCGRLGTTLFIGRGDGICRQYYFPWGGENITAALAKAFEIRRAEAERLKRKVILSLDPKYVAQNDDDCIMQTEYAVDFENETHMYPVDQVNETVRAELDRFVKYVAKTLKVCDYDYPKIIPLSLTGGGVNHIRGAAEYISAALGKDVETVCPELPLMERPQLSSALGLIDMVLCGSAENETLLSRFKRWIGRR